MVAAPQESHVADNQQQQQQQSPVNDWKAQKGNEVNGLGNGAAQDEGLKNGNDDAQLGQNGYNDHGHVNGNGYDGGAPHGMDAQAFNGTDPNGAPFYNNEHFGYGGGAPFFGVSDLPPGHRQIPCKFFMLGQCRNGDSCQWLHDPNAQQHPLPGPGPNGYLPPPPMPYGAPQGGQFMYYGPPYHGQPDANGNPQPPPTSTPGPGMPTDQMAYFPPQFYYGGPPPHFQHGAPGHVYPPYAPPPNMANGMENGVGKEQQANGGPSPSANQQPSQQTQPNGATFEVAPNSPNSQPAQNSESAPPPSSSPELSRAPPAPQPNGANDIASPPPPMHLQPAPNAYMPYMPPFLPPHPEHFHPNMPPPPHMPHEAFLPPQADPTSPQAQAHPPLPTQPNSSRPQQAHDRSRSLGGSFGPPSFGNGRPGPRAGPTPAPARRNSTTNGTQASAAIPASSIPVKPYGRPRPYPFDLNLSKGERPPCAFFAVNMCRNGDVCGFPHPLEDGTDARSLGKGMCGVDGASELDAAKNRRTNGLGAAFASGTVPPPYGMRAPYSARNASMSYRRGPFVAPEVPSATLIKQAQGNGVVEESAASQTEGTVPVAKASDSKASSTAPTSAPAVANGLAGPGSVPASAAPSPEVAQSAFQGRRVPTKPAAHVHGHGSLPANPASAARKAPAGPGGKGGKGKAAQAQASAAPAPAPAPQRVPSGADFPALQSALSPNLDRSNSSSSAGATFRSVSGKPAPEVNGDDGEGWSDGRGRDGAPAVDPVHKSGVITRTASFDGELEVVQNSSPRLPAAPKISFASAAAKAANAPQPLPKVNGMVHKKEKEAGKEKEKDGKTERESKKGSKKAQAPVTKESAPIATAVAVVEATA